MSLLPISEKSRWLLLALSAPLAVSVAGLCWWQRRSQEDETFQQRENRRADFAASPKTLSSYQNPASWTTALGLEQPMVIATVGLPARGKSYITKMIIRYLEWTGFECKQFNVGVHRREKGLASASADFFQENNTEAKRMREQLAMEVQESMYEWLHATQGLKKRVAVFDATNTTISRRAALIERAETENVFLLFVESICNDERILANNYDLKLQNDDYRGMNADVARRDFMERVQAYERVYETINDEEGDGSICYIKLINVGQKVITRNCHGYLPSQVAFYLQNVHIQPRKIYLALTPETSTVASGKVVSSSSTKHSISYNYFYACAGDKVSEADRRFPSDLLKYIKHEQVYNLRELGKEILVLTGTSRIHLETISPLKSYLRHSCYQTPMLNELRGGDLHGLTKEEIKKTFPKEFAKREADKVHYRYPGVGGESYIDVMERLRPVIIELERQRRSIVIVAHLTVLRCIRAYFMGVSVNEIPKQVLDFNYIYELNPGPFGCTCRDIDLQSERPGRRRSSSVPVERDTHDPSTTQNIPGQPPLFQPESKEQRSTSQTKTIRTAASRALSPDDSDKSIVYLSTPNL